MKDPPEFLKEGSNRAQVAFSKKSLGCLPKSCRSQRLKGISEGQYDVVEDARVPIAVNQAFGAAIPNSLGAVELVDGAHGLSPKVTAPEIEIPVQIEVLKPSQAGVKLLFFTKKAFHLIERRRRVDHMEPLLQSLHFLKSFK